MHEAGAPSGVGREDQTLSVTGSSDRIKALLAQAQSAAACLDGGLATSLSQAALGGGSGKVGEAGLFSSEPAGGRGFLTLAETRGWGGGAAALASSVAGWTEVL